MCAPAYNTCNGKHRCIKLQRQIQHAVNKSAVKIHIGTDTLIDLTFLCNNLWCKTLYCSIQLIILHSALFSCKLFYIAFKDFCTWIGNRIDRMSHTIDQSTLIKSLFMKKLLKICTDFLFITVVMYMFTHIVKHFYDFDVGTAVFRAFQRAQCCRDRRIRICPGRGNHMCSKGRVITTTMFHMKDQSYIKDFCLQCRILLIWS